LPVPTPSHRPIHQNDTLKITAITQIELDYQTTLHYLCVIQEDF